MGAAKRGGAPRDPAVAPEPSSAPEVVDPPTVDGTVPVVSASPETLNTAPVRVRVATTVSFTLGGAHYNFRAGDHVSVPAFVAEDMVRVGSAVRI